MMKCKTLILAGSMLAFFGNAQAQSIDPLQVRDMAAACASCHGDQGRAEVGMVSLAGANKDEVLKKMLDYKTGKQPSTIMQQLAKGYSDDQLAAMASYFSAQRK